MHTVNALNWAVASAHCVLNQRHRALVRPRQCARMDDDEFGATQLAESQETGFVCCALSCPFCVQPRQVALLSSAAAKKAHVPDTLPVR